ncbi:MAG: universal stress protein [Cellvibrionaceae bacterium]
MASPNSEKGNAYINVLIAVDTTKSQDEATEHANKLIKQAMCIQNNPAYLHLFHACEHPITGYGELTGKNHAVNESQIRQESYQPMKKWAQSHDIPANNIHIGFGDTSTLLNETCLPLKIDLVVIGGNTAGGFQLFGSNTTDDVIHHTVSDVLTVRL